jgi:inosine-uridine nucleoside N-ribohydrolase
MMNDSQSDRLAENRQERAPRKAVILDTDMSPDSWLAILFLLQRHDVDVQAITIVGTGECHTEPGVRNARRLAAVAGRPDLPIAGGRETPLGLNHRFPLIMRWVMDRMLFVSLPDTHHAATPGNAVELLTTSIERSLQAVTLITVGGLTNVAEAFRSRPSLVDKVDMICTMGGAVDVPGNIQEIVPKHPNEAAEWNLYVDPVAASMVVQSGAPLTLVPLDATNQVPVTAQFFARLEADRSTPAAETAYHLLRRLRGLAPNREFYLWDPMTVAVALDPSLGTFEQRTLQVIEEEGPLSGATLDSPDGAPVRVCKVIDNERFGQAFIDGINGRLGKE